MKSVLLGALALAGLVGPVQAFSITEYEAFAPLPATDAPTATSSTASAGTYLQGVTAPMVDDATSPFINTVYSGRSYDAVLGAGSATFSASSFGGSDGAAGIFTFVLGSPDAFDSFTFSRNGVPDLTISGSALPLVPANGYFLTQFSGLGAFDSVTFTSSGNALEFAALSPTGGVSAVPLPASAPMFGTALMALGVIGRRLKRRTATV